MKISFLFLIVLILAKSSLSQNIDRNNKYLILWDSLRKLTPSDFRIKRLLIYSALSHIGLKYHVNYSNDSVTINVVAFFDKRKSSSRDTITESLLKHEQLHFDIAELNARMIKKEIEKVDDVKRKFDKIYRKGLKKYFKMQDDYDRETKKSLNESKQKEWEYKINLKLLELQNYSSPLVKKLKS